jgi:hypothetical protein
MTAGNNLAGLSPTVTVAITTTGQSATTWNISGSDDNSTQPGTLGISLSTANAQVGTVGGSLALIVFKVLDSAPSGPTNIYIVPNVSPIGSTVPTSLTFAGGSLPPRPPVAPFPTFVNGVDGIVTVTTTPNQATHFLVSAPSSATAGNIVTFTVTAETSANTPATAFSGTVSFTSTDTGGSTVLPISTPLVNGTGVFSATLTTAGSQTLTATDNNTSGVTGTITGTSGAISVSAATASHFVVSAPGAATAGNGLGFTVTAKDQFNNTATGYTGIVSFTSSDTGASTSLPTSSPLVAGVGTFSATLTTAGSQTLTATDSNTSGVTGTITGVSGNIDVSAATAAHFVVTATNSAAAGIGFDFTVTVKDRFNNTTTGYTGIVSFSSTDLGASTKLPTSSSLIAGVGTFSATLTTAGSQTLTATDNNTSGVTGSISGSSGTITVSPAAASHFTVEAPGTAAADIGFALTVTAEDQFNNTATGYTGTVDFTSTDVGVSTVLPGSSTLAAGVGTFSAILSTIGSQAVTAADSFNASISGTATVLVTANLPATHFLVIGPGTATAGNVYQFTVTAETAANATATGYTGTVAFTSSDHGVSTKLPTSSVLTNGVGVFSATLTTAGGQTLTATDTTSSGITGTTTVTVSAGVASHFQLIVPSASTTAGSPFAFFVIAQDPFNNTATGYGGTVLLSSSDTQAFLSLTNGTLTNGIGVFAAMLKTAGSQTVVATDSASSGVGGASTISVSAAAASRLVLNVESPQTYPTIPGAYPNNPSVLTAFDNTGAAIHFTVTAKDPFGNTAPSYSGTVVFASSDTAAGVSLPSNATLTNGLGVFSATLATAGNQNISVADATNAGIAPSSTNVVLRSLVVTGFAPTASGFTVTFNQPFNVSAINLYSAPSDPMPDDVILSRANAQVSVRGSIVVTSPTSFTFVKSDTVGVLGTFNPASGLLTPGKYTVTLRAFTPGSNGFEDALGDSLDGTNTAQSGVDYTITFSVAAPPVAVGIPDFARGPSNTDVIFLPSTIGDGNTFNLIYTNPNTVSTGTATVTFSTTAATLQSNIQTALNNLSQIGTTSGTPNSVASVLNDSASAGANVLVTFQNSLATATGSLLSSATAGVSIGLANINVSNAVAGNGIPIALSSGLGVTSGSFALDYNPSMLNITGAVSQINGATFTVITTIDSATSATAVISLSSPTPISATTASITIGSLLASVPLSATAAYGAKQLLHFSALQLNGAGGPIPITNDDGIELIAYFGDVTATGGPFTNGDAQTISAVAAAAANTVAKTVPGFSAYPNVDPALIGDVGLQGFTNFTDVSVMLGQLASPRATIPVAPAGLPIAAAGPDPTLSVDGGRWTADRDSLGVSVSIDTARPQGSSGMTDAVLALTYDPNAYTVSAADVHLGTVPLAGTGWQLQTEVNSQTGLIGVELFSNAPIHSTAGGSLVTVTLHPRSAEASAAGQALTFVQNVDPSGGARVYETRVSDAQGAYVLEVVNAAPSAVDSRTSEVGAGSPALPLQSGMAELGHQILEESQTTDALPVGAVEQAFVDAAPLPENCQMAVAALLSAPLTNSIRDLALLEANVELTQPQKCAGDELTQPAQVTIDGFTFAADDDSDRGKKQDWWDL